MQQAKLMNTAVNFLLIAGLFFSHKVMATEDQSLFWSIESGQEHAGYLLGTIHSEDPRVLEFTDDFIQKLSGSSQFAMELVPDLGTLKKLANTMHLPEGTELSSIIGTQRFDAVVGALTAYGVPSAQAARMKPWAAMITLSVPVPKTGFFMDLSLSLRASGSGLKVIGLETLEEQLGFMENMPLEYQLTMLDQAVLETARVSEIHEQMVSSYLKGNLSLLLEETESELSALGQEAGDYFIEEGIIVRNRRMLEGMVAAMKTGTVFTAVGALHLPGEEGLLALLRKSGYELTPLPLPFPPAE